MTKFIRIIYGISIIIIPIIILATIFQWFKPDSYFENYYSPSYYPEYCYWINYISVLLFAFAEYQCIYTLDSNGNIEQYFCNPIVYKRLYKLNLSQKTIRIIIIFTICLSFAFTILTFLNFSDKSTEILAIFYMALAYSNNIIIWGLIFSFINIKNWVIEDTNNKAHPITPKSISGRDTKDKEIINNLPKKQIQFTEIQREAGLSLIAFFAGFKIKNENSIIIEKAISFFDIHDAKERMPYILSKYTNPQFIIKTISTIQYKEAKEFILLSCYKLAIQSGKSEAINMLFEFAQDMGYTYSEFSTLINNNHSNIR